MSYTELDGWITLKMTFVPKSAKKQGQGQIEEYSKI